MPVPPSVPIAPDVAMPIVGLGTWQASGDEARRAVLDALEVGYRHIDTATMYRNEDAIGLALRDSDVARNEVFLTTKLPEGGVGHERRAIEASLSALGVDSVDLWLIHWPPGGRARPDTWATVVGLRDEGLARSVGVSNYTPAQLDELTDATGVAPAVNQIEWGPELYDAAVAAAHAERGVVLEGYSPFKTTDLTAGVLRSVAEAHGKTPAQVVLRWHLHHGVVVIPKSSRKERIAANFDIFDFELSDDELAAIDGLGAR